MLNRFSLGVCYYPEHWPASRHEDDFRRMRDSGIGFVRMGEGAWSYFEPRDGEFHFDLFDRAIDLCRRFGIRVIFGTPTYCGPAWIAQSYPEVLRWNFQRIPMAHGSRRNFTYSSDKYIELSDRICTALASHYAGEKQIVAWQLDNEFNCHMDVSYSPSDSSAFRKWLEQKYGTLEELNRAWGTSFWSQLYTAWEQVDLPAPTSAPPNPTHLLDESRFISDTVVAFARRQARILRKHTPHWLITHNGLFSNINGPDLARELDFFSHDQYPLFSPEWPDRADNLVQARSLSFPFAILEQQSGPGGQMSYLQRTPRPGELRLWAWQSVAHGAAAVSFFRWRTCPFGAEEHWHGLLDPDNKDTRRLAEAKTFGSEAAKLPPDFFAAAPMTIAAVYRDFDNEINERRINTYIKGAEAEHARWLAALALHHIPADYVWPESSLNAYRLLILPHIKIVTPKLAERLNNYVTSGGILVLGAQSGLKTINCHLTEKTPPGLLAKLAGAEVEDWTSLGKDESRAARFTGGETMRLIAFVERLRPSSATVVARWSPGDALLGDSPAVTVNAVGKGKVYYIGGYCPAASIEVFLQQLINSGEVSIPLAAGREVEIVHRVGRGNRFIVALNHSPLPQRVGKLSRAKDLISGKAIGDELILGPLDVAVLGVQDRPSRSMKSRSRSAAKRA